jgi:hypothetical protein
MLMSAIGPKVKISTTATRETTDEGHFLLAHL